MKNTILLLLLCFSQIAIAQGIKFDKAEYEKTPIYEPEKTQGFANGTLATKISYREFCPPVFNQKYLSTCVGWSIYSQLSTQQNILMNEKNSSIKLFRAMDPYFLYSLIRDSSNLWCSDGSNPIRAFEILKNNGIKPWSSFPEIKCNSIRSLNEFDNSFFTIINAYQIIDYKILESSDLVQAIKLALSNKKPVFIGARLPDSFNPEIILKNSLWSPTLNNFPGNEGHAMCIIGYDDSKFGGSFEIMNSWGGGFADNGFIWIKYQDLIPYLVQAYVIELNSGETGFREGKCTLGDCMSSYSRYVYDNGDVYEGEFKNGLRNGWGMLIDKDYCEYVGTFENGYKHGWGVTYTPLAGIYSKTYFNYGKAELAANKQGFSGSQDDKKLDEVLQLMQTKRAGKILDPNSDEYEEYIESLKSEEEPVKAE
jgi:hypothetical protein